MVFRILCAIAIALTVPVSQLQTVSVRIECCCPDPQQCHCPDHSKDRPTQPSLRACHRTQHETVSPQAPSFDTTEVAIATVPPRVIARAIVELPAPHAAPLPEEPYGPS